MTLSIRSLFSLTLIILSILGMMNVYGDNTKVESMARELACPGCKSTLRRMERSPLSQTFYLQVDSNNERVIECRKTAVFFGDYECDEL